jgi:hypothetical protein
MYSPVGITENRDEGSARQQTQAVSLPRRQRPSPARLRRQAVASARSPLHFRPVGIIGPWRSSPVSPYWLEFGRVLTYPTQSGEAAASPYITATGMRTTARGLRDHAIPHARRGLGNPGGVALIDQPLEVLALDAHAPRANSPRDARRPILRRPGAGLQSARGVAQTNWTRSGQAEGYRCGSRRSPSAVTVCKIGAF